MKKATERLLVYLKQMFVGAHREGAEVDDPEGSRYIVISDTLASEITKRLEIALQHEEVSMTGSMSLGQLAVGNAFEYFPNLGGKAEIGFKTQGVSVPEICPCVLEVHYGFMSPDARVMPLCKIEEFDTGIGVNKSTTPSEDDKRKPIVPTGQNVDVLPRRWDLLANLEPGTVFESGHPFGLMRLYMVTSAVSFTGVVVADIGWPTALEHDVVVNDLGYAGFYNGMEGYGRMISALCKESK